MLPTDFILFVLTDSCADQSFIKENFTPIDTFMDTQESFKGMVGRISGISDPVVINGRSYCSIKLVDQKENVKAQVNLWNDQVHLIKLMKRNDVLAIWKPSVTCDVKQKSKVIFIDYGPDTVLFCIPRVDDEDELQVAPIVGINRV